MNCFYCNKVIEGAWDCQRDHFPLPQSRGGTETVEACNKCHHLKDRSRVTELFDQFNAALAACADEVVAGWNDWLTIWETSGTAASYARAMSCWEEWPVAFRLTAGRLMAMQEKP